MPKPNLPPGPGLSLSYPFLGDPVPWLERVATEWPDPMTVPIPGSDPIVLTWTPGGIEQVFRADPDLFAPGAAEALAAIVGRGSLFLQSGDGHRRMRKLLQPPFHGERMRAYGEVILRASRRRLAARPVGLRAPVLEVAQGITLDVILEAIFGARDDAEVAALHGEVLALVAAFNPLVAMFKPLQRDFGGIGPWAAFQRRAAALHARMRAITESKRSAPGEDVLSLLLAARTPEGDGLSEQELFEQLVTFVIAGHETTSTTLAWSMYELHRHPDVLERLRNDLSALGPAPSPESVVKLPFLGAVVSETLRRHVPVPIVPRTLRGALELGGHVLAAGTKVAAAIHLAHHHAPTFEEPQAFRPERFLGRTYTPFEYLPWGGGARRCLGAAFASYELHLALAVLVGEARWALHEPKPVPAEHRIGTYGPKGGIRMTRVA